MCEYIFLMSINSWIADTEDYSSHSKTLRGCNEQQIQLMSGLLRAGLSLVSPGVQGFEVKLKKFETTNDCVTACRYGSGANG